LTENSLFSGDLTKIPMKEILKLNVNGKEQTVEVDPTTPLLYVLRNNLALNGPKFGCGLQQCGACMVLLNGKATPSCLIPVKEVRSFSIKTLDGLAKEVGTLHPVQAAFIKEQAAQCGFCMNGMIISAVSLLDENPKPDDKSIREGMQRVLCRCGTQARIIRAIKRAAQKA